MIPSHKSRPMKGTVKEKLLPTGNRAHFDDAQ
jgi:hypothetical protein